MAALFAFLIMEIAARVLPGHRLTLPVVAASIGAAVLGKFSYSAEKALVRRVRRLLAKLGARDRVQLVIIAYQAGLIDA